MICAASVSTKIFATGQHAETSRFDRDPMQRSAALSSSSSLQVFVAALCLAVALAPTATADRRLQQTLQAPAPSPLSDLDFLVINGPADAPGPSVAASGPIENVSTTSVIPVDFPSTSDTDQMNFALNLEYLMAEFYSCAVTGKGVNSTIRGGGPASIGCQQANLTNATASIAVELADNEVKHILALREQLGSAAIPMPEVNVGSAFSAAAQIAFQNGGGVSESFSPYADDLSFLLGAFMLEEPTGFTYYEGAIQGISNRSTLIVIAKILGVEAAQSAALRTELYQNMNNVTKYGSKTVSQVVNNFGALRGLLGAGTGQGLTFNYDGVIGANLIAADGAGLAFARNPAQVEGIVLLGRGSTGGFFPNGLNGNLTKTINNGDNSAISA
ncbi:hypothetical protein WJX73_002752 [Symbiochloris irregularis]|uniref:Desiccation-related protein PCC13-62 n=1 Tax=Symbiochloris irregularis TaxID=706552 RepID=A0AAW1PHK8_9CHLO